MFKRNKVTVIWFLTSWLYCSVKGHAVDLFSAKDRHGNSIRIDVSDRDCTNIPEPWLGRVVSVDTMGNCMQFYENSFCRGSLTVLQPFHVLHQMDLSLINFANVVQSVSPCGPKVSEGRYVIQNAADASILTVERNRGGFSSVETKTPSKVIQKSQQWDITEKSLSEFSLKPREYEDNYPVSFDEKALKKGKIVRKRWQFLSVGRGRYVIKSLQSKNCLYKTEEQKVEEIACRIFSPNQEWVLRPVLTPTTTAAKPNAPVGPGLNLNILSKVSQYRPTIGFKPKPDLIPIYLNSSIAHQIIRPSSTSYQIRKKIKRGPRPQSHQQNELAVGLRPPGLRPALPSRISNNNDYLLLKLPSSQIAKRPLVIPHSLPHDKEITDSGEDNEEGSSDEKESAENEENEEEEEDEEENRSDRQHFRTNTREKSRPLLQIVVDRPPKINSIELANLNAKYKSSLNKPPKPHQNRGNIFSISKNNFQKNTGNKYRDESITSAEIGDSKEDSSESFMKLFMKKFKEKMSSVGSRWSRKKEQQKRKKSNQPRTALDDFLDEIE